MSKNFCLYLRNIVQNNGVEPFSTFKKALPRLAILFYSIYLKNLLKKWRISESNR